MRSFSTCCSLASTCCSDSRIGSTRSTIAFWRRLEVAGGAFLKLAHRRPGELEKGLAVAPQRFGRERREGLAQRALGRFQDGEFLRPPRRARCELCAEAGLRLAQCAASWRAARVSASSCATRCERSSSRVCNSLVLPAASARMPATRARAINQPSSETQENADRRAERERRGLELMEASDELGDRDRHGRTLPQRRGEVDRRGGASDSRRQRDDRLIVARNRDGSLEFGCRAVPYASSHLAYGPSPFAQRAAAARLGLRFRAALHRRRRCGGGRRGRAPGGDSPRSDRRSRRRGDVALRVAGGRSAVRVDDRCPCALRGAPRARRTGVDGGDGTGSRQSGYPRPHAAPRRRGGDGRHDPSRSQGGSERADPALPDRCLAAATAARRYDRNCHARSAVRQAHAAARDRGRRARSASPAAGATGSKRGVRAAARRRAGRAQLSVAARTRRFGGGGHTGRGMRRASRGRRQRPAGSLHAALRETGGRRGAGPRCLAVAGRTGRLRHQRLAAAGGAVRRRLRAAAGGCDPGRRSRPSGSTERDARAARRTRSRRRAGESPHPLRDGQWTGRAGFRGTRRHRARGGVVAGRRRAAGVDLLYTGCLSARRRRWPCAPTLPGRTRSRGGGIRRRRPDDRRCQPERSGVAVRCGVLDADACVARRPRTDADARLYRRSTRRRRRRGHPAHLESQQRPVDRRAGAGRTRARDDGRRGARPRRGEPRQRSAHQDRRAQRWQGHRDARLARGTGAEPDLGWRTLVSGDSGGRVALWDMVGGGG